MTEDLGRRTVEPAWRRVGVLGDVHGEDEALQRCLDFFAGLDLDAILCVGDITDGHGDVARCIELLMNRKVLTVAGNHERWFLAGTMRQLPHATEELPLGHRDWLDSLPKTRRFDTVAGKAMLCHGIDDDDMAVLRPDTKGYGLQALDGLRALMLDPDVQFMIGGHTHERMVRRFEGLTVINAGTLHREFEPGCVVIDFADRKVQLFDVRVDSADLNDGHIDLRDTLPLP